MVVVASMVAAGVSGVLAAQLGYAVLFALAAVLALVGPGLAAVWLPPAAGPPGAYSTRSAPPTP